MSSHSSLTATILEEIIFALSFAAVAAVTLNSIFALIASAISNPVL